MKGQTEIITAIVTIAFVAIFILVGAMIYGYTANATPHDYLIVNESICVGATCTAQQNYTVKYGPLINDSTFQCYNATTPIISGGTFNQCSDDKAKVYLRGPSNGAYKDVNCTYTYDWANDNQQAFWTGNVSNTGAGFSLLAALGIVIAAVSVVGVVLVLKAWA